MLSPSLQNWSAKNPADLDAEFGSTFLTIRMQEPMHPSDASVVPSYFICENGGRMARRRILARGMVRRIISAAGRKNHRASHRSTDGLASIGFLCCGIRSTRVETAVL